MSVIVRNKEGQIMIYCKGAVRIYQIPGYTKCHLGYYDHEPLSDDTSQSHQTLQISSFRFCIWRWGLYEILVYKLYKIPFLKTVYEIWISKIYWIPGYRTLCFGAREIRKSEYQSWKKRYDEAMLAQGSTKKKLLNDCAEQIEKVFGKSSFFPKKIWKFWL